MNISCKDFLVASILYFLSFSFLSAQVPDTLWSKMYGGGGWDQGYFIQRTNDNGYVVVGLTHSFSNSYDVYLIKTDSLGDTLWTKAIGDTMNEFGWSCQQTYDNGYIIAAITEPPSVANRDIWLVKIDSLGNIKWTKTFGGNDYDYGYSIIQTDDGGYIIAGSTSGDAWLIRTDSLGDTLWTKKYGGSESDEFRCIKQTYDGGYIVAGSTWSFGAGNYDFWLLKIDTLGDTLWTRTYGGSGWDECKCVDQTVDSGFILTGRTGSYGSTYFNLLLIRTNAIGDTIWRQVYGDNYWQEGNSVCQSYDGGYIIAGLYATYYMNPNFCVLKTDTNGIITWMQSYGSIFEDVGYSIQEIADNNYIATGYTQLSGSGNDDVWILRIGPNVDIAEQIQLNGSARYLKIFPNPFYNDLIIKTSCKSGRGDQIKIYNIEGKLIKNLEMKTNAESCRVIWNGRDNLGYEVPVGIYFIGFNGNIKRKVIKIK